MSQQVNFTTLRIEVHKLHSKLGQLHCPWCEEEITAYEKRDLHEALVKRSSVHKSKQHLIFSIENCVLLHHECHLQYGQTAEMKVRCLNALIKSVGAEHIRAWYLDLHDQLWHTPHQGIVAAKDDAAWLHKMFL